MMQNEKYIISFDSDLINFKFDSVGPKGIIPKLVLFQKIGENPDIYNLAFGDLDENTNKVDDKIITNNGDSEKVLFTVASTIYVFTHKYAEAWILLQGSSMSRTRLYQMGISKYLEEIKIDFDVFGLIEDDWLNFEKNQKYDAFLIQKKRI
jgi:hypothetical protein